MKRQLSRFGAVAVAGAVALVLSAPSVARAQRAQGAGGAGDDGGARSGGGGGDSGRAVAVPRGGGDAGPRGGGDSGGGRVSAGGGEVSSPRTVAQPGSTSGGQAVPRRPRDDRQSVGRAIPRSDVPPPPGGGTIIVGGGSYYGGYYPWGYGGLGLGGYYGLYDPWWYDPYYYGGGGYYGGGYNRGYEGRLRLKVQPSNAEVFVDGYYAGIVDEFDNPFQHLSMETGPHRIEVRQEGYEPLTFEVRILPGQTITYRGELKRIP